MSYLTLQGAQGTTTVLAVLSVLWSSGVLRIAQRGHWAATIADRGISDVRARAGVGARMEGLDGEAGVGRAHRGVGMNS